MNEIKQQLKQLSASLASKTLVITEIKTTYDHYNQAIDRESDADGSEAEFDLTSTVSSVPNPHEEPPKKKAKGEPSVLAGMTKVVNKPQQNGEDVTPELAEVVKQLLSKGMNKGESDELMEKFSYAGQLQSFRSCSTESTQKYLAALGKR